MWSALMKRCADPVKQLKECFWIRRSLKSIGPASLPRIARVLPSAGVTALPLRPVQHHSVPY